AREVSTNTRDEVILNRIVRAILSQVSPRNYATITFGKIDGEKSKRVMKTIINTARFFPLIWAVHCMAQAPAAAQRLGAEFGISAFERLGDGVSLPNRSPVWIGDGRDHRRSDGDRGEALDDAPGHAREPRILCRSQQRDSG